MARSKKKTRSASDEPTKDDVVKFRASAEEKQALEGAAKRNGLKLSAWLRRVALKEAGLLPEAE